MACAIYISKSGIHGGKDESDSAVSCFPSVRSKQTFYTPFWIPKVQHYGAYNPIETGQFDLTGQEW